MVTGFPEESVLFSHAALIGAWLRSAKKDTPGMSVICPAPKIVISEEDNKSTSL